MNTHDQSRASEPAADKDVIAGRKPVSRRVMLRGATAAVPAILTLRSGSALAVSSNMLSVTNELTGDGPALCLDVAPLEKVGDARYDLGVDPTADITSIPTDRTFYSDPGLTTAVTPHEMCNKGGTFYYSSDNSLSSLDTAKGSDISSSGIAVRKSEDFKVGSIEVPKADATTANSTSTRAVPQGGAFVSATALASFAGFGGISIKDIRNI